MANEVQRPEAKSSPHEFTAFFDRLRNVLNNFYENHNRLQRASTVLNNLDAADFVPALTGAPQWNLQVS
jgi:hypothetical protein